MECEADLSHLAFPIKAHDCDGLIIVIIDNSETGLLKDNFSTTVAGL